MPVATISLPKFPTFLGNFCKGVKIFNFSSEIILATFVDIWQLFTGHTGCAAQNYVYMTLAPGLCSIAGTGDGDGGGVGVGAGVGVGGTSHLTLKRKKIGELGTLTVFCV